MYPIKTKQLIPFVLCFMTFLFSCSQTRRASTIQSSEKKASRHRSEFDFVPGKNLIWQESFAGTAVGDLPKGWNTNAGAAVVTEGSTHALELSKDGVYIPLGVNLPQNFTLQFILACSTNFSYYSSPFDVLFAGLTTRKEFAVLRQYNPHNKNVVKVGVHPMNAESRSGSSTIELIEKGMKQTANEVDTDEFFAHNGPAKVKVSISRVGQRLRVYLNKEKIWDLPQAFAEQAVYNSLVFSIHHLADKTGRYYLSDLVLATDDAIKVSKNSK